MCLNALVLYNGLFLGTVTCTCNRDQLLSPYVVLVEIYDIANINPQNRNSPYEQDAFLEPKGSIRNVIHF